LVAIIRMLNCRIWVYTSLNNLNSGRPVSGFCEISQFQKKAPPRGHRDRVAHEKSVVFPHVFTRERRDQLSGSYVCLFNSRGFKKVDERR
jgi:hypothetical protein